MYAYVFSNGFVGKHYASITSDEAAQETSMAYRQSIVLINSPRGSMVGSDDVGKRLAELERRRQKLKKQRENCEARLKEIESALKSLSAQQNERVREITSAHEGLKEESNQGP